MHETCPQHPDPAYCTAHMAAWWGAVGPFIWQVQYSTVQYNTVQYSTVLYTLTSASVSATSSAASAQITASAYSGPSLGRRGCLPLNLGNICLKCESLTLPLI